MKIGVIATQRMRAKFSVLVYPALVLALSLMVAALLLAVQPPEVQAIEPCCK